MANIPPGNYTVTINSTTNNWANGVLNTNVTPPTYKGQTVWSGYNLSTTDVSWTVTLSHGGSNNCNVEFTGGDYTPPSQPGGNGTITGGSVTCNQKGCFSAGTPGGPVDSWSAEGGGQDEKAASGYKA
jgi:hypothetical protein